MMCTPGALTAVKGHGGPPGPTARNRLRGDAGRPSDGTASPFAARVLAPDHRVRHENRNPARRPHGQRRLRAHAAAAQARQPPQGRARRPSGPRHRIQPGPRSSSPQSRSSSSPWSPGHGVRKTDHQRGTEVSRAASRSLGDRYGARVTTIAPPHTSCDWARYLSPESPRHLDSLAGAFGAGEFGGVA